MATRSAIQIVLQAKDEASQTMQQVTGQFDSLKDKMSELAGGIESNIRTWGLFSGKLGSVAVSFAKTAAKIGIVLIALRQLKNLAAGTSTLISSTIVSTFTQGIPAAFARGRSSMKLLSSTWKKNLKETGSRFKAFKATVKDSIGGFEGILKGGAARAAGFAAVLIGISLAIKTLSFAFNLAKKAVDFFFKSVGEGIEMAHEQEVITNKLVVAMSRYSGEATKNIASAKGFAAVMQVISKFSNEQIETTQTLLLNMGVLPSQLNKATMAAANLATTYDKDLVWAGEKLGESFTGQAGELKKFVPGLENLTEEALKSGAALGLVNKQFSGAATAELNTYRGVVAQARNSWDDLKKAMGEFVVQGDFGKSTIRHIGFLLEAVTLKIKNTMFILRLMKQQKVWEKAFGDIAEVITAPLTVATQALAKFFRGLAAIGRFTAKGVLFGGDRIREQAAQFDVMADSIEGVAASIKVVARAKGEAFGAGIAEFLPGSVPAKGRDFGPRVKPPKPEDDKAATERQRLLDAEGKAALRVKDALEKLRQVRLDAAEDMRRGNAKIEQGAADKRRKFALADFDFDQEIKTLTEEADLSASFKSVGISAGSELINGIREGMEGEQNALLNTIKGLLPILGTLLGTAVPGLGTAAGGAIGAGVAGFLHTGSAGYAGQAHTGVGLRSNETFRILKDEMVLNRQAVQALGGEGRVMAAQAGIGGDGGGTVIINAIDTQSIRDAVRRGNLGREMVLAGNDRRGNFGSIL